MHLGIRYKDVLSARASCGTAAAQPKRGGVASHAHQATAKITEHTEHALGYTETVLRLRDSLATLAVLRGVHKEACSLGQLTLRPQYAEMQPNRNRMLSSEIRDNRLLGET